MTDTKNKNNSKKFICNECNFNTCKNSLYIKHLDTRKHKILTNTYKNTDADSLKKSIYICCCGKEYKHRQSLYTHKKKCSYKENNVNEKTCDKIIDSNEGTELKELIMKLLVDNEDMKRENQKLMSQIVEIIPKVGNNNNNTTNKTKFNINVFLNEKCKDALSMDEFIDKIQVSMKNLLTTKDKGLGTGLSNIIMDNMNKLSLYERPIHCTDKKRETLYVKNNQWRKDESKSEINKLIKRVEKKQINNIEKWIDENPKFMESERLQEDYMYLIKGCTSSIEDCSNKVIKNICDKIFIDKE